MSQKKAINAPEAPKPIGPYSPVIVVQNLIFVSGQIAIDPKTNQIPEGIKAQARGALSNLKMQIEAAGGSMHDVVQVTVYLIDMASFAEVNEIYQEYFMQPYPTRAVVAVKALPKNALIEITAIAIKS